jgi:hypothetical protein
MEILSYPGVGTYARAFQVESCWPALTYNAGNNLTLLKSLIQGLLPYDSLSLLSLSFLFYSLEKT